MLVDMIDGGRRVWECCGGGGCGGWCGWGKDDEEEEGEGGGGWVEMGDGMWKGGEKRG